MNHWIFKEDQADFSISVDKYIEGNKKINWIVGESNLQEKIKIADKVFIWHSDDERLNSAGIIAEAEVISEVYESAEKFKVDLKIRESRHADHEGMLMRYDLKDIPEGMNLAIINNSQEKIHRLSEDEYKRIENIWINPKLIKERLMLSRLEKYLYLYKWETNGELPNEELLKASQAFFANFKEEEYLEKIEWEEIKELGDHINALNAYDAKDKAFGEMGKTIEEYRASFNYLINGKDQINERINNFLNKQNNYKLPGIGRSSASEIIGNIYSKEYCFYNKQDEEALENILKIHPEYRDEDKEGDSFLKFQEVIKREKIKEKYENIVGKLTKLPVLLEIHEFFSYLYINYNNKTQEIYESTWLLSMEDDEEKWKEYKENEHFTIIQNKQRDLNVDTSNENNESNLNQNKYDFCNTMQIGDYVFIKNGEKNIIGYGKIIGQCQDNESIESHQTSRSIKWIKTGNWNFSEKITNKTKLNETDLNEILPIIQKYQKNDFLDDMFMPDDKAIEIIKSLDYKKNIILQGPPGVGKTFAAKRIAYLHMGQKKPEQIETIQFHQSYSYEDFIRGYKPAKKGEFELKNGLFYDFCEKAKDNPNQNHYMIIDEINRGNLSKIFGELMMLIEADKRGEEHSVKLAYTEEDEKFYIPENIYLIGTMNTADRSLSLLDFALRRRFAFITLEPGFDSEKFYQLLKDMDLETGLIDKIKTGIKEINEKIRDKKDLGKGFEIGHSYFCPNKKVKDGEDWLKRIVDLEIKPLLEEYYYDEKDDKVDELISPLY